MGRVAVIGAINMDLIGKGERLPRRSETLVGGHFHMAPGGKGANQAVAARRAGAQTTLIGSIGSDTFGRQLGDFLAEQDLDLRVSHKDSPTGVALVLVDQAGENAILVAAGANDHGEPNQVAAIDLSSDDVALLQAEIPDELNIAFLSHAKVRNSRIVLNLSPFRQSLADIRSQVDYIIVNELEFAQMISADQVTSDPDRVASILSLAGQRWENTIVTLGRRGVVARLDESVHVVPAYELTAVDTTGAGDCFCGAFAARLALNASPLQAVMFANAAAGISVCRIGAANSMPSQDEVTGFMAEVRVSVPVKAEGNIS